VTRLLATVALCTSLAACAGTGTPPASIQLAGTQAFIVAEQTYDTVVVLATNAVNAKSLPAPVVAKMKALVDTGHAYVVAGRLAVRAGDANTLATETAALSALAPQLKALFQ